MDFAAINAAIGSMSALLGIAKNINDANTSHQVVSAVIDLQIKLLEVSKTANELLDENRTLKDQMRELSAERAVLLEGGVNWEKKGDGTYDGPLCPSCWGLLHKRHPMVIDRTRNNPDYVAYECGHHNGVKVLLRVPKTAIDKYTPDGR